jgi:cell division septum initiation protein DivIVA
MILCSVTIITLGPSLINANTTNCEDLKIRVESQNTQIIELNKRVSDLNTSILQNQSECTNRLINKEKEIYDIISEMENELQKNNKPRNNYRLISQETDSIPTRTIETNETPNNKKVLKMIKKVKSKLCQETSK